MSLDLYLYIDVDTGGEKPTEIELFSDGITHNVGSMWRKAGVYEALYESHDKLASSLVETLEKGYKHMFENEDEYIPLNPANGWGSYEGALHFLRNFTWACKNHPKARVYVSR